MTRTTVTALPGGLDFTVYPSNPLTVRTTWPDSLAGRTFEVRIDGIEDPVTAAVADDVLTWTFPTAANGTHRRWELWETTDDAAIPVEMGGTVRWLTLFDNTADEAEVTVLVGDTIDVTVQAGALIYPTVIDGGDPDSTYGGEIDGGDP